MSARPADITKKRKARPLYDGGDYVSHGRQSGINTIRIAKPFTHPLDIAADSEATASSHQTKRPRYQKITRAQLPTFEERSMRDVAARKAGEHSRPVFLHRLTYELALPMSLQQALADDDGFVNDQPFDMNLDGSGNADDWITDSEDDGECDEIIDDLRGEPRDTGIRSVAYFSVIQN